MEGPLLIIPESTFLGFHGDYTNLENVARRRRDVINLGQNPLTIAINLLTTSMDFWVKAESLIIVVQMTSKSIKFVSISNCIAKRFGNVLPPQGWH